MSAATILRCSGPCGELIIYRERPDTLRCRCGGRLGPAVMQADIALDPGFQADLDDALRLEPEAVLRFKEVEA